jgi:hypothetical protein
MTDVPLEVPPADPVPEPEPDPEPEPQPKPEPQPSIAFVFRGPGMAEFQVYRQPTVTPMMLSPVKDYLETLIFSEFAAIMQAEQERRLKAAQEAEAKKRSWPRRFKNLTGGKLFKN